MRTPRSRGRSRLAIAVGLAAVALTTAVTNVHSPTAHAAAGVPRMDHVVIVVMENKDFGDIIGRPDEAPFLNDLEHTSANMVDAFAASHPSQPNYLAMFSGSTQGVTNDDCPKNFGSTPNLGSELIGAGDSFVGYSEGLPTDGALDCTAGGDLGYARKHNPWADFTNVPAASNRMFSEFPSWDYSQLPTVSYVVPNLCDDMHSCSRDTGDAWAKSVLYPYAQWAVSHNSLLIVTWDEDNDANNHIPTIIYGAHTKSADFDEYIDHYRVLRTIEDMYGLPYAGQSANRVPITDIWN